MTIQTYEQAGKWVQAQLNKKVKHVVLDMLINPPLAEYLLSIAHPNQRFVHDPNVNFIRSAIERNEYVNENDFFVVSTKGTFDNGIHRATTVYKTSRPIVNHIIFNANPKAQKFMDCGKVRSLRDHHPELTRRPDGRSGLPLIPIASTLWRVFLSKGRPSNRIPEGEVLDLCSIIRESVEILDSFGFGTRDTWNISPAQAALVLHMLRSPGDSGKILLQYSLFNTLPSQSLDQNDKRWASISNLQTKYIEFKYDKSMKGPDKQKMQLLLTLKAFSEQNKERKRVLLQGSEAENLKNEWGTFLESLLSRTAH